MLKFYGTFDSFCHVHHGIQTASAIHSIDDECVVCKQKMGEYHAVKCVPLKCCNNGWCHKRCLKEKAFIEADSFVCPSCQNEDDFYVHMLMNGIYIPNR